MFFVTTAGEQAHILVVGRSCFGQCPVEAEHGRKFTARRIALRQELDAFRKSIEACRTRGQLGSGL